VPYLYTWARRSVSEGVGPVRPVYHDHPREMAAYQHRSSFCFGDLLVVPFTSPLDETTGLGRESAWLPDGVWYDLPTGRRYDATTGGHGRMLSLSRPLDRIGVLARAGSVIPLTGNLTEAAGDNPHELEIVVVPGGSGVFTLEEDDGSAEPGPDRVARTRLALTWPDNEGEHGGDAALRIRLEGAADVVPDSRQVRVRLLAGQATGAWLGLGDQACRLVVEEVDGDGFTLGAGTLVHLGELSRQELADGVELVLRGARQAPADWHDEVHAILDAARVAYAAKDQAWAAVERGMSGTALLGEMESLGLPEALRSAVAEVLPHS
jgi:family 31 glycosyl hydrolase, alpha-glucosidase